MVLFYNGGLKLLKMREETVNQYPETERKLLSDNLQLQEQLVQELEKVASSEKEKALVNKQFVSDGFFPYYTKQKIKILFLGKESLGLGGLDYVDTMMNAVKTNNPRARGSKWTNNKDPFWSKILYTAYGLNNGFCDCKDMPRASEIGLHRFAVDGGISFAVMNFSKFDNYNPRKPYSADYKTMWKYREMVERTGRNWYEEQIDLLNPDVIISMNIANFVLKAFKIDSWNSLFDNDSNSPGIPYVNIGYLPVKGRKIPLINTKHFSYPGKSFKKYYYVPIVRSMNECFKIQP